ncbi:MAG: polysulfide reductase NrfD [Desulfitobacteriaceae bacterium]|nr:polysulfide reductase NrfD [Desulfitobacteriaceae bacterium]MDI6915003.1 polysulfide reductase NrfD [Desulfitobacteriaceae bacterium]
MEKWGWLLAIYLFLGGIGAGAYLSSFAAEKGLIGDASSLKKTGYYISAPAVAIGALLLVFDLGQGLRKPWLILGMFANLSSVMTWGIYILSAFILVGLVQAYFVWKDTKAPAILTYAGAVLAVGTMAYTGLLLSVVKAVPFWHTNIMPVLFIISALSTGLSATSLLAHFLEKGEVKEGRVCQTHLGLVSSEIIVLTIFFGLIFSGSLGPMAVLSAQKLFYGSLAVAFWVVLVSLGLVGPFILYAKNAYNQRKYVSLAVSPVEALNLAKKEQAATGTQAKTAICICDGAVMVGGLALRCVILFAALPVWNTTLS